MTMLLVRAFALCCLMAAVVPCAVPALADDFPSRPVRLIVGFAPGGATDITARLIAQALSEQWGQQVVVENRPGAGTVIASTIVMQSPPDGYTLYQNSNSHVAVHLIQKQVPFDPIKDFTPISKVFATPNIILVNKALPANNLGELIALARSQPGKLSYGNPGYGTITHFTGELFKQMAGIDITAIAYRGGALSVQALIAGELPMTFNTLPEVTAQIDGGTVRPIAMTTAKRSVLYPNIPTVGETVPGYAIEIWQAWFGPPGMPAPLLAKINGALVTALASPGLKKRFAELGAEAVSSTPDELTQLMRVELSTWTRVAQASGIHPE